MKSHLELYRMTYTTNDNDIYNNNDIYNHHRNIEALLIEVFKMKNEIAPVVMESL